MGTSIDFRDKAEELNDHVQVPNDELPTETEMKKRSGVLKSYLRRKKGAMRVKWLAFPEMYSNGWSNKNAEGSVSVLIDVC